MIQNEKGQKKRSPKAVAYRSENIAILSVLPGLHTNHLYVSMFNCSQTSCYNLNDASLNGLALLLLKSRHMVRICPFTMSSGFFSALWRLRPPYRFSCIFCVALSSLSTMMSLAGGIFFFKFFSSDFETQDFHLPCSPAN